MKKLLPLLFLTSFCAIASAPQERVNPDLLNAIDIAENHTGGYAFKEKEKIAMGINTTGEIKPLVSKKSCG